MTPRRLGMTLRFWEQTRDEMKNDLAVVNAQIRTRAVELDSVGLACLLDTKLLPLGLHRRELVDPARRVVDVDMALGPDHGGHEQGEIGRGAHVDQRLTDLEIKSSFTEDTLEQLNQVVIRQQHEIEWLLREVKQLRQQIPQDGAAPRFAAAGDDLPPHY